MYYAMSNCLENPYFFASMLIVIFVQEIEIGITDMIEHLEIWVVSSDIIFSSLYTEIIEALDKEGLSFH